MKGDMEFYKQLCGISDEKPIKKALKIYKEGGVWIEITNLVIPGYNDSDDIANGIINWIKENLGVDTPFHISRFFPHYKLTDIEPTPIATLEHIALLAEKAGLKYIYIGNVYSHTREHTYCPKCKTIVIERHGYEISKVNTKCPKCGTSIPIKGLKN